MNPSALGVTILLGIASAMPAQEVLWDLIGPYDHKYYGLNDIGDYDQDGNLDVMVRVYPYGQLSNLMESRILDGLTGATLWSAQIYSNHHFAVGDMDGDGSPDFASYWPNAVTAAPPLPAMHKIQVWSPRTNRMLWEVYGAKTGEWGFDSIGKLDTDGDGRPNMVTISRMYVESDVYVYNHLGRLLYKVPMVPLGLQALSVAAMGDLDGDGCDDFVVGCADLQSQGTVLLISGRRGQVLRTTRGLQSGDKTCWHATNVGDLDGDGVEDYAAFPWWSATRLMACCWSGATGALIRTWPEYTESVIVEDLDLDGVNDLVLGWEYPVLANTYGRSIAISGRDSTTLWHVDNHPGSWQGPFGWGRHAASLGVQPGSPYPVVVWQDQDYWNPTLGLNVAQGRTRAWRANFAGQGPIVGDACSSTGELPQIGVRNTASGARITIANAPAGAFAWLNLALGNPTSYQGVPLPLSLQSIGLSGCTLYVGPELSVATTTGTSGIDRGYAAVELGHSLTSAAGTVVQGQWIVFDPNTLDYALTARHQVRLQ